MDLNLRSASKHTFSHATMLQEYAGESNAVVQVTGFKKFASAIGSQWLQGPRDVQDGEPVAFANVCSLAWTMAMLESGSYFSAST